jgi:ABC-type uncharacterized transport system substrate-binding protein
MHKEAQTRCFHLGISFQKCHWAALCLLTILFGLPPLTHASPDGIDNHPGGSNKLSLRIVTPKNTKKGVLFENVFNKHPKLNVDITRSNTDKLLAPTNKNHIIITVGAVAFHQVLKSHLPHALILATYISKSTYFKVLEVYKDDAPAVTAIFSDIPLDKQIQLAKILIPQSTHLTTLLGKHSKNNESLIRESAHANKLEANVHYFEDRSSLNKLFKADVFKHTFILALSDSEIFNARSLKHILLKGYRNNMGVIGPNKEAVSVGSLASLYFPDKELVRVSQNIILDFKDTGVTPSPQNLKSFNFVTNKNVAKSMNINIPPDVEIKKALGMDYLKNHEK